MASVLVTIDEAPQVQEGKDILAKLSSLEKDYAADIHGESLYEVDDKTVHIFGIRVGEEFDTQDRNDPRTECVLRLCASCYGIPVSFGVEGLQAPFVEALGKELKDVAFSFSASVDFGEPSVVRVCALFTPNGLTGTWETYTWDDEDGSEILSESGNLKAPPPPAAVAEKVLYKAPEM